ncbi:uncharacterized protein METZ01_LOCUS514459, partial [marine metagenome]
MASKPSEFHQKASFCFSNGLFGSMPAFTNS